MEDPPIGALSVLERADRIVTAKIGNDPTWKWMVLLTLSAVLPLVIVGLGIVVIYHQDLRESFIAIVGIVLTAGVLFSFFLGRKLTRPDQQETKEIKKGAKGSHHTIRESGPSSGGRAEDREQHWKVFENSKDAVYITSADGRIIDINPAGVEMLGYASKEELTKVHPKDFYLHSADRRKFINEVANTGFARNFETKLKTKDGVLIDVLMTASARKDMLGNRIGYEGFVKDISERKRIEEDLRKSEERYRTILENIQDGYFEIDLAGNYTFVNDAECVNMGYAKEELIGMNNRQYTDEESAKKAFQAFNKLYRTGEPVKRLEMEIVRKDGTKAFNEISVSLIRDSEGKPTGFRGISRDVTERKRAEEALRESEEKYRNILENIQDGYFEVDLAGNFTLVNGVVSGRLGYSKEELIGMNNRQYTDETTAKKVFELYNRIYRTGEPVRNFEEEVIRKDGARLIYELSISLIRNPEGKPIGFRGISRDITERKRAEEVLRQSEERARRLSKENEIMAEIGQIISSTLKIEEVYERFAEAVRKLIPFDRISVNIMNPDCASVTTAYTFGIKIRDLQEGTSVTMAIPFREDVVNRRSSVLIQTEDEGALAERYPNYVKHFRAGLRSMIATPLISQDQLIGILHIQSLKPEAYTESDVRLTEKVGNQIAGAIANAQLFAARQQAEEALQKSEEKYRTILESIEEGYYEVDFAGNFTFLNDSMCHIFGYHREELMDMKDREYTDRETTRKLFQAFNEVYRTGKPGRVFDYEIIRKDGTKRHVETSLSLRKDASGNATGFRGIIRDVTEHKRAEEALRQSEERYRTILETIEEGYYEVDLAGNFTFFNDSVCQIFGYPREELMGMNNRQYTDQETTRKLFQASNEVYRTGKPGKVFENEIIKKDGTRRDVETSISLRKDATGKPMGFRGIIRDITDKKRIEEQLFQAEKLRAVGEMASGVAHDFNNALAAILGNTQLLLYTVQDKELRETLNIIEKVAKDSSQTVRRLQDFTRKGVPQKLFKVDLNAIVKDSIEITKPKWKDEAQSRGIHIEMVSHLEEIPLASGNVSELREVVTNMIFNAIEALHGGGRIEIRTFRQRRDVCMQISDTGVGIAEETKKRIFEPFFTTKPFTNTGLGLSMSYGIVKRFGGEIEVESKVGQGAVFTITLPIGEDEKEETVDSQPIKKGRRARILVIDDDAFVRSVLSRTLAQADHQVTLAEDGGKGVQLFKGGGFDMVLTDLGMPGVSGWEVCRMIKEISPRTPVGMVTGWGDEKNRGKMEEYGLDFFISKPFDFAQILNVVAETMESRKE